MLELIQTSQKQSARVRKAFDPCPSVMFLARPCGSDILPIAIRSETRDAALCRSNRDLEENMIETLDPNTFADLTAVRLM